MGELIEYKNGAVKDAKTGLFVKGSITRENARDMAKKSHEARRKNAIAAAEKAIIAGSPGTIEGLWDGVTSMLTAQTRLSHDTEKGHASTKAAEFVLRTADMLPDRRSGSLGDNEGIRISLSNQASQRLAELLAGRARETVTGAEKVAG